ncbi:MAG: hypothetical protein JEZ03_03690 [Bacteroidales bacterium]|nr:hypothetical protein [Bacteroidales bacterium]
MGLTKDQRRGLIGTIGIHALVVLMLFFLAFVTPLPLPGEEGVEVNLGYSDQGMGKIQPKPSNPPAQAKPKDVAKPKPKVVEQTSSDKAEEIKTQNTEEAPAIEEKKEKKKEEQPKKEEKKQEEVKPQPQPKQVEELVEEKVEEVKEPDPVTDPRAMYPGKSKDTPAGNQGITGQPGDQGKPDGDPVTDTYEGLGGEGNGISFSLKGRKAKHLPKPTYDSEEQGRVVVTIYVNKYGEVTRAVAGARGTTVSDQKLHKMAREAALRAKFSSNPEAPEIQKGMITYTFVKLN